MENKRQSASSSSSSITSDLFGPKDSSPSSGIFGSIFPPAPMMRRDPPPAQDVGTVRKQDPGNHYGITTQANPDNGPRSRKKGDHVHPHHFSSSIYYGGQESYSPHPGTAEPQPAPIKKKAGKDGNGSNSNAASRGNWWEGSLYY